ncbi:type 1 fimbrial protein [Enterobacter sp. JUb54]|uniref:fimbrial protein n=1 Tax=Enterobacter sp. JUb54 TaxID=2724468 RepID=UPI00164E2C49|nr:fimbrial protein [Enterobacter sp. JUb54]QNK09015.1 type 1 fimbrial protein [Enterobacter sp. JUb54]
MKLNKIVLATVMTMGLGMASVANAADEGQGKITFTGSIVDAPCSITAGSADQTIPLGAISNIALAANGGTGVSVAQPFSIELVDCVFSTPATRDKVTVTFTGAASSYDADSLGLIGSAKGAYILMSQADGDKVVLNTPTNAQTLKNGNNTLAFTAALKGGGNPLDIVPGNFNVPTNFMLSYN